MTDFVHKFINAPIIILVIDPYPTILLLLFLGTVQAQQCCVWSNFTQVVPVGRHHNWRLIALARGPTTLGLHVQVDAKHSHALAGDPPTRRFR
jgi:hypothetical protein